MTGVELKGVRFAYDGRMVLADLNLNVRAGEMVCLLGPSGCGKSTLLRLLAGLLSPSAGVIERQPGRRSFVFQDARLLPWKNVVENVLFPFDLTGEAPRVPEPLLRHVGLWEARGLFPHQLSGGMQQRVAIARALISEPQMLLMDEPFSALDEGTRQDLQELIRELWVRLRITIFFVTHSLPEAVFLGERVLVMGERGRLLSDQRPQLVERGSDLRTSPAFNKKVREMGDLLRAARGAP